ncbi:Bcr/CflA family efflux MFS transporter [Rhodococcus hoagii]|nr:Bcr/CflA family efflux MFS transporter [Prescottella equi]MBM4665967.1 Bcr/CflA family efflux MFS transporter [Prescottella equi]NKV86788.1 Bcr/CflA family efflux MFS transporter [Prescottella equi]
MALGTMTALGPFTIDMYLPALPDIAAALDSTASGAQLTITGTLVGLALGQLVIGPLSDSLGRKRPLVAGIALHVASSLVAVFATSIAMLGAVRVLQGVGAAAAAVVTMAMVRDLFSDKAVAVVISRLMLVLGVAPVIAPSVGGALLVALDWRGIFVVLALVGVSIALVAVLALPETLPRERRRPGGLLPVVRTYRALLRDRTFVALTFASSIVMAALFAYVSGAPFVYQDQFGLDQQQFAIVFSAGAFSMIGATQLNVRLLRRWSPQQIVQASLTAAVTFGIVAVVVAHFQIGGLPGFVAALWIMLGAVCFVLPNAPALALTRNGEAAGTAAALLGSMQYAVGAVVAPLVGLLGNTDTALVASMTACLAVALVTMFAAALTS